MTQHPRQYPPPQPSARSQPHRSYTKQIVIVAVAVLVGCLGLGGISVTVYKLLDTVAKPKPLPSAVSKGPIYHKLPSACTLPAAVVRGMVPDPEEANRLDRKEDVADDDGARTLCQWGMSVAEGKRRAQTRDLRLTATAYLDGRETGGAQAKQYLDYHLEPARKNVTEPAAYSTFGPVEPLEGIGQEAHAQDSVTRSGYTYGGTTIWVLLDNLVLEISYHGSDNKNTREQPMSATQARQNATTAAREFTKLLESCVECRS